MILSTLPVAVTKQKCDDTNLKIEIETIILPVAVTKQESVQMMLQLPRPSKEQGREHMLKIFTPYPSSQPSKGETCLCDPSKVLLIWPDSSHPEDDCRLPRRNLLAVI